MSLQCVLPALSSNPSLWSLMIYPPPSFISSDIFEKDCLKLLEIVRLQSDHYFSFFFTNLLLYNNGLGCSIFIHLFLVRVVYDNWKVFVSIINSQWAKNRKKSAIQGKSLILIIGVRYIYRGMSSQLLQKMSCSFGYFGQQISCQKKIPDIFWCAVYFRYNSYDFKKQYIFCTLFFLIFSPVCMITYHSISFPLDFYLTLSV